jgi:feruloyl esterase
MKTHGARRLVTTLGAATLLVLGGSPAGAGVSCTELRSLALPAVTITMAESLPPGAFSPPGGGARDRVADLPAMCRVAATLTPSDDSDIRIEVWLPEAPWNGKYQAVGNGGWAGSINYAAMGDAIRRGYATSSTDTGHVGGTGAFAHGHPEKLTDFAYRAVHEMTAASKRIVAAFYGAPPRFSYWNGCSAGGRQGLKSAERFPDDFDGVIAGDSANPSPLMNSWQLRTAQVVHATPESFIPASKYGAIHQAVLAACDADDGRTDGLLHDPLRCRFDPQALACPAGSDGASCLTAPQVDAARAMFSPVLDLHSGAQLAPGIQLGAELEWGSVAGVEPNGIAVDYFKYVVKKDAAFDWTTLRFETDLHLAREADAGFIEARPDLGRFVARGGKLLMYHGWSDARVPPRFSIDYYEQASRAAGDAARDSMALFLVPGLGHCRGGDGYNTFDLVSALEAWVEHGEVPRAIPATRVVAEHTERAGPLCAYPSVARPVNDPASDAGALTCVAP